MDKNQSVLNFLSTCNIIRTNPLFFNFGNVEDNAHQIIVKSDDISLQKPYIDGSVLKRYTITIDSFKSITAIPVVDGYSAESLTDLSEVQELLEWVNDQADIRNFPNFGADCAIDDMKSLTEKPTLLGVDDTVNPPIAIYRISIQIDYIDTSKRLWS